MSRTLWCALLVFFCATCMPTTKKAKHSALGACSASDRKKYIHDPNPDYIAGVRRCSRASWAHKEKTTACLQKTFSGLSKSCAECFADMAKCSLNNCKLACALSSTSKKCINCANENCQSDLIECTGVERQDLP
jgi:hypothetical protein